MQRKEKLALGSVRLEVMALPCMSLCASVGQFGLMAME